METQENVYREALPWPYEVDYNKVTHVFVDVLVVGGGLAGCCAGISAAKRGCSVAVADKAPIRRSGCGGAGLDHFNGVFANPDSPMSPEEVVEKADRYVGLAHRDYIAIKGTWDALLQLERMGLKIRDDAGFFDGAPTKDSSGILKAFDYKNFTSVKMYGGQWIKQTVYDGLRSEPTAQLFERVMITSLFNDGGKRGGRVAGALGFSMETGELFVFHTKTVILSTGYICSCWIANLDITGNSYRWDPNEVGEGMAMAWKAGAEVFGMQKAGGTRAANPFSWPRFGVGNPNNTWFPCTMVDNNGKEIPWEDGSGAPLTGGPEERNIPMETSAFYGGGLSWRSVGGKTNLTPNLIHDLGERIQNGEYELPMWADLSALPEEERRSIWGVMIGNEGKTRFTIYDLYTRAGFNPEKHMLMAPIMEPENYLKSGGWFHGEPNMAKTWRSEYRQQGEVACDWDLMTNVPGLYVAGATGGLEGSAFACSSGFYAGNRAAEFAADHGQGELLEAEWQAERTRIYAPAFRKDDREAYVSWKELWAGSARVMQQCCGQFKTVEILKLGLKWLDNIRKTELQKTYAANPHELARVAECETRITCSEVFLNACISQLEASKQHIDRNLYLFCRMEEDGSVRTLYRKDRYWLQGENEPDYLSNYRRHTVRGNFPVEEHPRGGSVQ